MLIDFDQYHIALYIWLSIAAATFLSLMYVRAPYGRHERPGWGARVPARLGWVLMESPCIIVMTVFFGIGAAAWDVANGPAIVFYILWMAHYIHRSWAWPPRAKIRGKKMPLSIVFMAIGFNSINSWLNAEWMFDIGLSQYTVSWFWSPQFIAGAILFIGGMTINIQSDEMLFSLRKNGSNGDEYKIPEGGFFRWVSCPNYMGEIIEWLGWALMTWSLAGLSFALWAVANLVPRARANHKWYHKEFEEYPEERKALIPFLW